MPMDALCLSAVCREVEPAVLGGRIDKIYQPSRDEILLQIRCLLYTSDAADERSGV